MESTTTSIDATAPSIPGRTGASAPVRGTTTTAPTISTSPSARQASDGDLERSIDRTDRRYPEGVEVARGTSEDKDIAWRLWAHQIDGGAGLEFASEYRPPADSGVAARGNATTTDHRKLPIEVLGASSKAPAWAWVGTLATNVASVRAHTPTNDHVVLPFDRELFARRYFVIFLDVRPQYFVALGADGNELGRYTVGSRS